MIERNVPLASKVATLIRKRLYTEYLDDERLPCELDLMEEFGVSRGTIRQALSILQAEGTIHRLQGDGTYPNGPVLRITTRVDIAYEFTELITKLGYKAGIAPIKIEIKAASDEIAGFLDIEPGSLILAVHKLFTADSKPVIYCSDFIPKVLLCESYSEIELEKPIYRFLAERCGIYVSYIIAEFSPVVAEGELVDLLHYQKGEACAQFDEINYNINNQPVMFARIYYKEPFTRFTVLRRKT